MSATEVGLELYLHQMSRIGESRNLHHRRYRSELTEELVMGPPDVVLGTHGGDIHAGTYDLFCGAARRP
jgi:hypothetical protein